MEGQCKKSYWVFFEGTGVMLTYGLAYKNTLSLQCFIYGVGSVIVGFCVYDWSIHVVFIRDVQNYIFLCQVIEMTSWLILWKSGPV